MRIEQLQYLLEISKTHSISLAADNLFLTQPALSNAIKKLEKELGVALFTRSKNGVLLTLAGKDILESAANIINEAHNISRIIESHKTKKPDTVNGNLKLQVVPPMNFLALPATIPLFHQRYPEVTLDVMENNPEEIIKALSKPDFDLYIFSVIDDQFELAIPALIAAEPSLIVNHLSSQRMYASVSQASPLAKKNSISLKEIAKQPLGTLTYTQNDYDFLSRALKDFGEANIVFRTNNIAILSEEISKGHCITITTTFTKDFLGIKIIPISTPLKLQFYYAYDGNNPQMELIVTFLQILKTKL